MKDKAGREIKTMGRHTFTIDGKPYNISSSYDLKMITPFGLETRHFVNGYSGAGGTSRSCSICGTYRFMSKADCRGMNGLAIHSKLSGPVKRHIKAVHPEVLNLIKAQ